MDSFQAMKSFNAVVEYGGFAAAARVLGVTRSAVTKQVTQLETQLGVQLLVRSTRRVTQTDAGQRFYESSRRLVDEVNASFAAAAESHQDLTGNLRINAPMSFGTRYMAPIVAEFMRQHPSLHVELVLNDRFVDLIEEGFDLTLRVSEAEYFTSLVTEEIATAMVVLCASPGFVAERPQLTSPAQLAETPCLHYGYQRSGNRWRLGKDGNQRAYRIQCVMWSNNGEVLKVAAAAGRGIALLPTFLIAPELQSGQLLRVLPEFDGGRISVQLLYPRHRHIPARTRSLAEFIGSRIGDPPLWQRVE